MKKKEKLKHQLYQNNLGDRNQKMICYGDDDTARLTVPWNDTNVNSESGRNMDVNTGWPRDVTTNKDDEIYIGGTKAI